MSDKPRKTCPLCGREFEIGQSVTTVENVDHFNGDGEIMVRKRPVHLACYFRMADHIRTANRAADVARILDMEEAKRENSGD